MNLQPVTGRPFQITCASCCKRFIAGDSQTGMPTTIYADLDGVPFKDYYCALCAGNKRVGLCSCGRKLIRTANGDITCADTLEKFKKRHGYEYGAIL